MDSESSSPVPAEPRPPATPLPPATAPRSSAWSWMMAVPLACLAATLGFWYETHSELAQIRQTQSEIVADMGAARGTPLIDLAGAPILGSPDAPVTLIEFADYECPYCLRHFTQTMPQIEANYIRTGKVRYVFRDFPIDQLHPGAIRAHEAAHCATEQNRFWEMHRLMFSAPGSHTDATLEARAQEAGLKLEDFRACLASGRTTSAIRQSVSAVTQLGANGTPTFFFGIQEKGTEQVRVIQAIAGAQPYSEFEKIFAAVAGRVKG
jgi:protein-disulfide isomerase